MELKWEFENGEIKHPGTLVRVNKHKIHIYKQGKGTDTIVLMAGAGTCCPTLDFKPLWACLSPQFTVAVVEKAGYGWSETANVPRDIDTILYETRTALKIANIHPPYILMPHSLSGIEALAWARQFPNEVKAIIGLDAAIPILYEQFTSLKAATTIFLYRLLSVGKHLGLLQLIAKSAEKSIRACGQFSEEEISIYKYMFIHNSFTKNMLEEVKHCCENAKKVADLGCPKSTPYLSFISDGKETGISNWCETLINFIKQMQYGKYVTLDCGHYIHYYEPTKIALEIEKFIFSM